MKSEKNAEKNRRAVRIFLIVWTEGGLIAMVFTTVWPLGKVRSIDQIYFRLYFWMTPLHKLFKCMVHMTNILRKSNIVIFKFDLASILILSVLGAIHK